MFTLNTLMQKARLVKDPSKSLNFTTSAVLTIIPQVFQSLNFTASAVLTIILCVSFNF